MNEKENTCSYSAFIEMGGKPIGRKLYAYVKVPGSRTVCWMEAYVLVAFY